MKKIHVYILLLFVALSILFINKMPFGQASTNQQVEYPNEGNLNKDITNQGTVVFSYKPDYDDLSKFLGLNKDEYFKLRKNYSMLEIAFKQNILEDDLFNYLVTKRFEALENHYKLKKIDLTFIMNYTLHLKEDVKWEMEIKSIK